MASSGDNSDCSLDQVVNDTPELHQRLASEPKSVNFSNTDTSEEEIPIESAPQRENGRIVRATSNLIRKVQESRHYRSVAQTFQSNGKRFNDHIHSVKRFSRRAAIYTWIQPTALILSFSLAFILWYTDKMTSYILLFLFGLIFSEVLMVLFSLAILIAQTIKSQNQPKSVPPPLTLTRFNSGNNGHIHDENEIENNIIQDNNNRESACTRLIRQPPQVVRWDIVGVTLSNWFGKVNSIPLPVFMREPLYKLYSSYFGVKLDEIRLPLSSFRNMQEFFSRELKPGLRPIAQTPLVSPVDAKMVVAGRVDGDHVEQVKGVTYPLSSFLGQDVWDSIKHKKLYHCVLYLAPGDYHRIHSATTWSLDSLRHFPGTLFPISPIVARLVPNLFALNERVALVGKWDYGFFSSTAVGAYHVGSMAFNFDTNIRTNRIRRDFKNPNLSLLHTRDLGAYAYHFEYTNGQLSFNSGDELGTFKLGSTIVLVFEVPDDGSTFKFDVSPGDKVQMGQALGHFE